MEKLFDGEYKLMEVLWQTGAVHSARLVELCAQRLGWNKSTTYTVLRRLKNKGAVDHRDTVVTPLLTRQEALRAQAAGADYLGAGAVFHTGTKTDVSTLSYDTLGDICAAVHIPVVAIGGINEDNILRLKGTGIAGAAVVSALFAQPDVQAAARHMRTLAERVRS